MPGAQTTSLPHHDESTKRARVARPNSMVLVSCSSLRRSVLTAVRARCAVAPRNHRQTSPNPPVNVHSLGYLAHAMCPQQRLSSVALRAPVCLTPNRRAPHRCRPNHAVTFWSASGPSIEQRSKCSSVHGQIGLCISSLSDQLLRVNTARKDGRHKYPSRRRRPWRPANGAQ